MKFNLSRRETEVLYLIVSEYTSGEIASQLHVSEETIRSHRKKLLYKMSARNAAGLVRRAFEYSIIPLQIAN